jgi:hypothetical protein
VTISKKWAFAAGARPVIYQRDSDYSLLPDELHWRHVRYEPDLDPPIDFSWEREWRIRTDSLQLVPSEFTVLVPDKAWADALLREHVSREEWRIYGDVVAYGEWAGMQTPEPFRYRIEAKPAEPAGTSNAGSRPSSRDSPASETPSAPAPRG